MMNIDPETIIGIEITGDTATVEAGPGAEPEAGVVTDKAATVIQAALVIDPEEITIGRQQETILDHRIGKGVIPVKVPMMIDTKVIEGVIGLTIMEEEMVDADIVNRFSSVSTR